MTTNCLLRAYIHLSVIFCMLINLHAAEQILWDLGMVINTHTTNKTYQKEFNFESPDLDLDAMETQKNIKALYSDNFIAPIIHTFKNPLDNDFNIIKTYDQLLEHLSFNDKIYMLKNSFLNKEYLNFLNVHSMVTTNSPNDMVLEEMYIQNLYYTKQHEKAINHLNSINDQSLTDILLYYKIKVLLKLKKTERALEQIALFISHHKNSDLLPYVQYDKKSIEMNNEN